MTLKVLGALIFQQSKRLRLLTIPPQEVYYLYMSNENNQEPDMSPKPPAPPSPPNKKFIASVIIAAIFGFAFLQTGVWFLALPMVFAGILPAIEAYKKMRQKNGISQSSEQPKSQPVVSNQRTTKSVSAEKQILRIAKQEKGRVTPALIALHTDLSIEESEKMLEEMAKKGYVNIHVTTEGRMKYEFPDFLDSKDEELLE